MTFSRSLLLIMGRVMLLFAFIVGAAYSYYQTEYVVTPIMLTLLTFTSTIELTWHLQQRERNWTRFLLSIKHHDFSRSYINRKKPSSLDEAFELITSSFEQLKTENHAEDRLLQTVLGHIPIGLMCYRHDGEIVFSNKALKTMLGVEALVKIVNLKDRFPEIYQLLSETATSEGQLIEGIGQQRILVRIEPFTLQQQAYRLVSMSDIKSTLDANELESYQRLMSVMTHEIMNSTTPILSLIKVVNEKMVEGDQLRSLDEKDQKNISISMRAIETRTQGMMKFVEAYRQINREFDPILRPTSTSQLIEQVVPLINSESHISIQVDDQAKANISVDPDLVVQVVINLLKNAVHAVGGVDEPRVMLQFQQEEDDLIICVSDNGPGVDVPNLNKIFIPFYTTREDGSGIGLALSRKVAKAHGGRLSYVREGDGETQFQLILPSVAIKNQ